MKSKFALLVKLQLYGVGGLNRMLRSGDEKGRKKGALVVLGACAIGVFLAAYSALFSVGMASLGLAGVLPAMAVAICSIVTLVLTFLKSNGALIGQRDYDMVMSLPVKSGEIVLSRLTVIYLSNLAVTLAAGLPPLVVYGLYEKPGALAAAVYLVSLVLVPILPLVAALAFGVLTAALFSRFRHKNLLSILFSLALVLAVMAFSMQAPTMDAAKLQSLASAMADSVKRLYPPAGLVSAAVTQGRFLSFLLFAAVSLLAGAAFAWIVARCYKRLNTLSQSHSASHRPAGRSRSAAPLTAMIRRELRRYFSCTIWVVNSLFSMVMLLALSVALIFLSPARLGELLGFAELGGLLKTILPAAVALLVGLCCTTAAALSLEGKNRWILFSAPVRAIDILNSKIAVNLILILPVVLLSAVLLSVRLGMSAAEFFFLLLAPVSQALFISVAGMFFNVKYPKYDWTNEYQVVKGVPASGTIAMLLGLVSGAVPLAGCILLPGLRFAVLGVTSAALLLAAAGMHLRLRRVSLYA